MAVGVTRKKRSGGDGVEGVKGRPPCLFIRKKEGTVTGVRENRGGIITATTKRTARSLEWLINAKDPL